MFVAVLFTVARKWKKPKCPSTEECKEKIRCINRVNYHSPIKRNKIIPFAATSVDLETISLGEVCRRRDRYHMMLLTCGV